MTWVKFFRAKTIEQALNTQKKGEIQLNPLIKGGDRLFLKRMFNLAQTRFVFDPSLKRIGNNMDSPFHKFPKGIRKEENLLYKRITKVRLGIINAKEKEFKWRQDFINKRKYRGFPQVIRGIMPTLIKQSTVKTERSGGSGGNSRKVIAESVKGVPKVQKDTTRKQKEHFKNFMDDAVISQKVVANMISSRSKKQTDRFEQFKKKDVKNLSNKGEDKKDGAGTN
jgi:hypothetical protein